MQKISIYIFGNHIANMYQEEDKVFLKQIGDLCHKVIKPSSKRDRYN
jgi:serine/threonine-protein kinase HipA